MKEELETKILKSGTIIVVTTGEYTDYSISFTAKVLNDFDIEKVIIEYPFRKEFNEYTFGVWLVEQGYIKETEVIEWELGKCKESMITRIFNIVFHIKEIPHRKGYFLERWASNGGTYYLPFETIAEVDAFRKEHPEANGTLWTRDGHQVNEDKARKRERGN